MKQTPLVISNQSSVIGIRLSLMNELFVAIKNLITDYRSPITFYYTAR